MGKKKSGNASAKAQKRKEIVRDVNAESNMTHAAVTSDAEVENENDVDVSSAVENQEEDSNVADLGTPPQPPARKKGLSLAALEESDDSDGGKEILNTESRERLLSESAGFAENNRNYSFSSLNTFGTFPTSNAEFWKSHNEWRESVIKRDIFPKARVEDPKTTQSNFFSKPTPTVYYSVVFGVEEEVVVKRRYSDFEWLHGVLRSRYVGMMIPPLPPKKLSNTGKFFVPRRMHGLNLFLRKVIENPYLKTDVSVRSFLSQTDNQQWEATKKASVGFKRDDDNVGQLKWLQALASYEIPKDSKNALFDLQYHVISMGRQLEKLYDCCDMLALGVERFSTCLEASDTKFQDFLLSEKIPRRNSVGEGSVSQGDHGEAPGTIPDILATLGDAINRWHVIQNQEVKIVDLFLKEAVRFEQGMVLEMKQILKQRSDVIKMHDQYVAKRVKHEREKKELLGSAGDSDKLHKLESKLEEDHKMIKNTYEHALFITKGLFFSGVKRFLSSKTKRIAKLKDLFALASADYHQKMAAMWKSHCSAEIEGLPSDNH